MAMLEIPVTLIVKAPNQQVEDQTIRCSLSWTIKRLKGYLSEVYPSKPNTEDQRLIYYGQLLSDSVTLEDVFTRYEAGEGTHTVHLVCMPSKESLKRRARGMTEEKKQGASEPPLAPSVGVESSPGAERLTPGSPPPQRFAYPSFVGYQGYQSPDTSNYMQQLAWMQQAYVNYMSQYMDMMARQNNLPGIQEGYTDPRQRVPLQQAAPPQPPQAAEVPADEDEGRVNRDWLDYIYIFSRVLVLFSIVYFYSSPARFVVVSILGITMYLYQIGFFRLNPIQPFENNNELLNNNVPAENNNVGEAAGAGARVEAHQDDPPTTPPPQDPPEPQDRPSLIALTWIFLLSFFASMIPETQNAI